MDNPTLVVRAVAISPFGPTGWLVLWTNKCLNLLVLPYTPQANGTAEIIVLNRTEYTGVLPVIAKCSNTPLRGFMNHWAYPKLPDIVLQRRPMPLQRRQPRMTYPSFNESCDKPKQTPCVLEMVSFPPL